MKPLFWSFYGANGEIRTLMDIPSGFESDAYTSFATFAYFEIVYIYIRQ